MTATVQPVHVGTLRYLAADWKTRLFGPEHKGADGDWLLELRNTDLADTPTRPAIAATPHREIHDPHLRVLRIASEEPARIHDALAGGVR